MKPYTAGQDGQRLSVLMITEGTYPYYYGGVSTWCHTLLGNMQDVDYTLLSFAGDPNLDIQFTLPAPVVDFRRQALWRVREALENRYDLSLLDIWRRRRLTTPATIDALFVPLFGDFLQELFAERCDPQRLGAAIHQMYRYFQFWDFDRTMRSALVWDEFRYAALAFYRNAVAQSGMGDVALSLGDLTLTMHWLYHWLFPLAVPVPPVDVAHAAMAGICTLVGIVAKREHGAAFMLTEHGIYLRERYLAEADKRGSLFHKLFSLQFARRMTELTYAYADLVAPCCDYNMRWELRLGASTDQIRTIYYGVDSRRFVPPADKRQGPPVVVWVGRIDPLKDPLTFLRAAAVVHRTRPDVQFHIYGSAPRGNEAYLQECLSLRSDLGLEKTVVFGGYRADPLSAYQEADVFVLSSVSEAFPFVIIEAMLCGAPVVATAVGGVPEEIEGCGIAVTPRNADEMGAAILALVCDPERRARLGEAARKKAATFYSVEETCREHLAAYRSAMQRAAHDAVQTAATPAGAHSGATNEQTTGFWLAPYRVNEGSHAAFGANESGTQPVTLADAGSAPVLVSPVGFVFSANTQLWETGSDGDGASRASADAPASAGGPGVTPDWLVARESDFRPDALLRNSAGTEAAIAALAVEVARRDPHPVDALEVTAVLESSGITDSVAARSYRAADAFELGERVLARLRHMAVQADPLCEDRADSSALRPPAPAKRSDAWLDIARGLLGLTPLLVLFLLLQGFSQLEHWGEYRLLALSAGVTASLLVTNGFIQGASRRASMYLISHNPQAAAWFLRKSMGLAGTCVLFVGFVMIWLTSRVAAFGPVDAIVLILAFGAFSAFWLAGSALTLAQKPAWSAVALLGGLLAAFGSNWFLTRFGGNHLLAALLIGYATTMSVTLLAGARIYRGDGTAARKAPVQLPSSGYLFLEAGWPFAYGSLYMVFILIPHALGWLSAARLSQAPMLAVAALEVGLVLSLLPMIILDGVASHALRSFWRRLSQELPATPGTDAAHFDSGLSLFYRTYRERYLWFLSAASLAAALGFHFLMNSGYVFAAYQLPDVGTVAMIFLAGLVAYGLLGWGAFNSMFCITLDRADLPVRAVILGMIVLIAMGVPLTIAHGVGYSVVAFIGGALMFCISSQVMVNRVMASLHHHYLCSQ